MGTMIGDSRERWKHLMAGSFRNEMVRRC